MAQWIETKLRYEKMMENGAVKRVTEPYLVDALSFTEAEAKIIEKMTPYISGDFTVNAVKKTKISEIFNPDKDKFYLVKVGFIALDEKTATEKRSISEILVGAVDFDDAVAQFKYGMKGTMAEYDIVSISESAIMEVI